MVHLFERECSIQRRYQKIIEEAPSPAVDDDLRAALGAAAVAPARRSATSAPAPSSSCSTQSGRFYFLEVNTRLQVEHPVTELVTGLDLVEVQLRVAEGEPLGADVLDAQLTGHAIEARLYAEDAAAGFRPAVGTLHRFSIPSATGVRVDAGYDRRLAGQPVLRRDAGQGHRARPDPRRGGRPGWPACWSAPRCTASSRTGTCWRRSCASPSSWPGAPTPGTSPGTARPRAGRPDPAVTAVHALAAALAGQAARRAAAPVLATLPSGWRNVRSADQHISYEAAGQRITVAYRLDARSDLRQLH